MKRGRAASKELTGGSGDVSPQFLTFSATQSGTDATTTTQQTLPIERLATSTTPTVLEFLKVYFLASNFNNVLDSTDNDLLVNLSTKSFGTTQTTFGEPTVLASWIRTIRLTTSGAWVQNEPFMVDLTDGGGHGVLVATDNLFAQVASNATGFTNTVRIKILYRFKRVSLAEYVGIVQSQQ